VLLLRGAAGAELLLERGELPLPGGDRLGPLAQRLLQLFELGAGPLLLGVPLRGELAR
jgi:hypothetical protein